MFGTGLFGSTPYGTADGADLSVISPFEEYLANPDARRQYLLDAEFWDPGAGALVPIGYGAGQGFETRFFRPFLVDAVQFETRLFGSISRIQPAESPTTGDIGIDISAALDDGLCDYFVDGRDLAVKLGFDGFTFGQHQPVFVGTAEFARWDLRRYSIALRDASSKVDRLLQTNRYAGTGGLEGGDDIKGVVKPKWYGACFNVPGRMVDRANLVVDFHDGEMDSIDVLYDKAEEWPIDSDVADETALYAWTPVSGHAITCNAIGKARLGSVPLGSVTADGTGDATGGYVDTAADIARRILQAQGGLADSALDVAAFSQLAIDQPARVGVFIADEARMMDVVRQVLGSIFGWATFTRTGLISVGRFEIATPVDEITEADIVSIQALAPELPSWRRSLGYRRSWLKQDADAVSVAATAARKDFVGQEFRRAPWEDATILVPHPLAEDVSIDTLLVDEADAQDEADRQGALCGPLRPPYQVVLKDKQFRRRLGETVTLTHPRFGLSGGRDCVIVRLGENTTTQRTTLELWG